MRGAPRSGAWLLVLGLGACARAPAAEPRVAEPRVAEARSPVPEAVPGAVLRIGTSGDYAPFSSRDASGTLAGFDIELAEQLAADLGLELRWVPFRWPELGRQLAAGDFDVAMGGVSWQPARAVSGYMTRALARGGPCLLGDMSARRVAVNRGGVLEAWARGHLADRELVSVDDNPSLPRLLAEGQVGAIVTDSFELHTFERPGWARRCEPAHTRKVYWVGPARAAELGARIDGWLRTHGARVQATQERWLGERQRLDAITHLVDLLARRFAFMPIVAGLKAEHGLPIEDAARERELLAGVRESAARSGLPGGPVQDLFALSIELAKAVQQRQREASTLDLREQVRPALSALGERIIEALAEARAASAPALEPADLELLSAWLTPEERLRLLDSLRAVLG